MAILPAPARNLLTQQFGIAGRFQLKRWLTEDQIDSLVQRGFLVPVERAAYRVAGGAEVPEQAPMAAALRARPGARVTGPFVLGLFDIEGFTTSDPFEVLRNPDRRLTNVGFPHRADPFPSEPRATFRGMPVVDVTTALLDTARLVDELGERRLRVAYDSARWKRLTTPERLRDRAEQLPPGHQGAAFFLELARDLGLEPESEPERDLGVQLCRFVPAPEPQVWVTPQRRVDWFLRLLRLALEYLGHVDHAHAAARLADADRGGELEAAGIRAVGVVAADLRDTASFIAWMQHVFGARAYELGVPAPRLLR